MSRAKIAVAGLPVRHSKLDRVMISPEGVPLNISVASAGARAGALLLDIVIILALIIGVSIAWSIWCCGGLAVAFAGQSPEECRRSALGVLDGDLDHLRYFCFETPIFSILNWAIALLPGASVSRAFGSRRAMAAD